MVIQNIQEVGQFIELKFKMMLKWVDARVLFYNLKKNQKFNSLSLSEQQALWNPKFVFWNTKKELRTINDETTFASVNRSGNGKIIDKSVNEDILTYLGAENPISNSRVYSLQFFCDYNMQWYPFDQQTCSIQMIMDGVLDSYADLRPRDLLFSGPQELSQYYVKHFLMEKAVINSRPAVVVSVTLGRRLLGLNRNYQITIFFNNSDLDRNISNRFLPNYSAQHYWFYYQLLQGLFL